jgi:hypothetical protein
MKKYVAVGLLGFFIAALSSADASVHQNRYRTPENYLTFSFFLRPLSVGYKHLTFPNVYLTGNLDYVRSDSDLYLQAGAAYMIPRKILIFRLFGGGGLEFSRNRGYLYPYVTIGTNVWILNWEIVHPLRSHESPKYRFGFSFSF